MPPSRVVVDRRAVCTVTNMTTLVAEVNDKVKMKLGAASENC